MTATVAPSLSIPTPANAGISASRRAGALIKNEPITQPTDDVPMASGDIAEIMGELGRLGAQVQQLQATCLELRIETASLRVCVTRLDAAFQAKSTEGGKQFLPILKQNAWLVYVLMLVGALVLGNHEIASIIQKVPPP